MAPRERQYVGEIWDDDDDEEPTETGYPEPVEQIIEYQFVQEEGTQTSEDDFATEELEVRELATPEIFDASGLDIGAMLSNPRGQEYFRELVEHFVNRAEEDLLQLTHQMGYESITLDVESLKNQMLQLQRNEEEESSDDE